MPNLTKQSPENTGAIVKKENFIVLNLPQLQLSDSERDMLDRTSAVITEVSAKLAGIERNIEHTSEKLNKDVLRQQLKELKRDRKTYNQVLRDASNKYRGAFELAFREVPGDTYDDKMAYIRSLNS